MRIDRDNAIGVVIDIQERLLPHMYEKDEVVKNTNILIQGLKQLDIPVMVTEQYRKGLGETVEEIAKQIEEFPHYEKITFSCCDDPKFVENIELSTKRSVIIAGIESHVCVLQTAIDLKHRGFIPYVVTNCTSSRKPEDKKTALIRMQQEGIFLTTYEAILFELARKAGTDEFKAISRLVK
ncbi:MAG: hydrolase [Chlorobi bacterium]|nr:hydrolase [Chlorobiota bacterium]